MNQLCREDLKNKSNYKFRTKKECHKYPDILHCILPKIKDPFQSEEEGIYENLIKYLEVHTQKTLHLQFNGYGGHGKTSSLWAIWEEFSQKEKVYIPVYIDLAVCKSAEDGKYHILNEFRRFFDFPPEFKEWNMYDNFINEEASILLLADCYNEIQKDYLDAISEELRTIVEGGKMHLIIASRNEIVRYTNTNLRGGDPIQAIGLGEDQIKKYCSDHNKNYEPQMSKILKIPMLLYMYCNSYTKDDTKSTKNANYDERNLPEITRLKKELHFVVDIYWNYAMSHQLSVRSTGVDDIDKQKAYIIFNIILPYIGRSMAINQRDDYRRAEIHDVINKICTSIRNDENDFFSNLFRGRDIKLNIELTVPEILDTLESKLLLQMGEVTGNYYFSHTSWPYFYAAIYEYYISKHIIKYNVQSKPTHKRRLNDSVRRMYLQFFDLEELKKKADDYIIGQCGNNAYCEVCNIIGDIYYYGTENGVDIDYNKALDYHEMSAKAGNLYGKWSTSFILRNGEHNREISRQEANSLAFEYAKQCANTSYPWGCLAYAQCLRKGFCEETDQMDEEERERLFRENLTIAKNAGLSYAYNLDASLAEQAKQYDKAFKLYEESAKLNDTYAKNRLGFYLKTGKVKPDLSKENKMKLAKMYWEEIENYVNHNDDVEPMDVHSFEYALENLGDCCDEEESGAIKLAYYKRAFVTYAMKPEKPFDKEKQKSKVKKYNYLANLFKKMLRASLEVEGKDMNLLEYYNTKFDTEQSWHQWFDQENLKLDTELINAIKCGLNKME